MTYAGPENTQAVQHIRLRVQSDQSLWGSHLRQGNHVRVCQLEYGMCSMDMWHAFASVVVFVIEEKCLLHLEMT